MDTATQSIEFALANNVVVYVVPRISDNLGTGIETGSVLEPIFQGADDKSSPTRHHERVLFIHESGVRSALIAAVQDRWEARVCSYEDRDDLVRQVRLFVISPDGSNSAIFPSLMNAYSNRLPLVRRQGD